MKKRTLLVAVLYFFICVSQGMAAVFSRSGNYSPNDLATATGTVEATGRNSIEIYDELQKRVGRFVFFDQGQRFHQGDYVRIYYHPMGKIVQKIKKMTVLEYKVNGQNLGYISH